MRRHGPVCRALEGWSRDGEPPPLRGIAAEAASASLLPRYNNRRARQNPRQWKSQDKNPAKRLTANRGQSLEWTTSAAGVEKKRMLEAFHAGRSTTRCRSH